MREDIAEPAVDITEARRVAREAELTRRVEVIAKTPRLAHDATGIKGTGSWNGPGGNVTVLFASPASKRHADKIQKPRVIPPPTFAPETLSRSARIAWRRMCRVTVPSAPSRDGNRSVVLNSVPLTFELQTMHSLVNQGYARVFDDRPENQKTSFDPPVTRTAKIVVDATAYFLARRHKKAAA